MTDDTKHGELLVRALDYLRAGIAILDETAAPGQIAAHVDLGLCQLLEFIETNAECAL